MPSRVLACLLSVFLAAGPASAQAPASALIRIGAAAAVRGAVKAQAPGQAVGRVIGSGKAMYLNDHVTTDAAGHLQVMLLDETVFTLGPNSDMVLDEFVYDPNTSAGKVTASIAKGTFRFVSGKIAHNAATDNMKIKLPVGTMGIRGTIGAGDVDGTHTTIILAGPGTHNNAGENPGSIALTNGGSTVILNRPGFGSTMLPGQPPTPPHDMSGQLGGLMGQLGTGGGSSGRGSQASSGGSSSSGGSQANNGSNRGSPGGGSSSSNGGQLNPTGSVGDASGQNTAAGALPAADASDASTVVQSVNTTTNQASQDSTNGLPSGLGDFSTWEQMTQLASVGQQTYQGSGTYTCAGGTCGGGDTGTMSFDLEIDFAARTYGGNPSSISLNQSASTNFGGDSTDIGNDGSPIPFGTGPALITLNGANSSNTNFSGTTIVFKNAGGVTAANAVVAVVYNNTSSNEVAGGSMTGPRGAPPPR